MICSRRRPWRRATATPSPPVIGAPWSVAATSRGDIVRVSMYVPAFRLSKPPSVARTQLKARRSVTISRSTSALTISWLPVLGSMTNSTGVGSVPAGVSGRSAITAPTASDTTPKRIRSGLPSASERTTPPNAGGTTTHEMSRIDTTEAAMIAHRRLLLELRRVRRKSRLTDADCWRSRARTWASATCFSRLLTCASISARSRRG